MFPDRDSYRDSKSFLDLMRSSGNDFITFDYRDSSKQFQDNFLENANFLQSNQVMMEESLKSFTQEKKKKRAQKEVICSDVEFEVREAPVEIDSKVTVKECISLMQKDEFDSAILLLESRLPRLINSSIVVKLALKKLNLFKNVRLEKLEIVSLDLSTLNETLKSFNSSNYTRSKEIICGLVDFPEVIKSNFYNTHKKLAYINSIQDYVLGSLTITDHLFYTSEANHNITYKVIETSNDLLSNFEEELIFYQACFIKAKHIHRSFDEFIDAYCNSLIFDKRNVISNNIIIEDFLYYAAQQKLKINEVINTLAQQPKKQSINQEHGPFHISKVSLLSGNESTKFNLFVGTPKTLTDENETIYSNEYTYQSAETEGNTIIGRNKRKEKKNIKLNTIKPFVFKQLKKENIDKKILRKFRKYVCLRLKQIDHKFISKFAVDFSSSIMFPPFTYNNQTFKSFNSSYLLWLFSNSELAEFFEEYIDLSLGKLIEFLVNTFKVEDKDEIENLEKYLKVMVHIYSNSTIRGHTIIPQQDINEVARRNTSTSFGLESEFMRLSVETQKINDNCLAEYKTLLQHQDRDKDKEKKNSILSNTSSNITNVNHKKSSLRMSVQQREELITKMFDEYTVDVD